MSQHSKAERDDEGSTSTTSSNWSIQSNKTDELKVEEEDNEGDSNYRINNRESIDSWVIGEVGTRTASLVFKSSALAEVSETSIKEKPGYKLHVTYKVLQAETKLLSKLLECHGVTEVATNSSDYNLLWTGSHPKPGTLKNLQFFQRVNHFPRSYELTRKDRLYKNIERMQHAVGFRHFDFVPQTFIMPMEFGELCSAHHRSKGPWIIKPVASSRGRGIFIVETPNKVPLEEPVVVAKYISRPLLVAGHKCDLRLYVAVTMMDPLLVYIYEEGLVRFATVKYDASHKQLWNPCMHLCNYSINKYHSDYVKSDDPSEENVGHKWTLSALLRHLKSEGRDTVALMSNIEDLIIKAILACSSSIISACRMFVPHLHNCFELYGFDILIDEKLKPWLLEVNLSPSLGCDSPLDVRLKSAMLADLLTLVGIPAVDPLGKEKESCSRTTINSKPPATSVNKDKNAKKTQLNKTGLSQEEQRMIKYVKAQFERRGGFVRIFPAADSWSKYSTYLHPQTGVPMNGATASGFNPYQVTPNAHNLNLTLHQYLFPLENITKKGSVDKKSLSFTSESRIVSSPLMQLQARQDRYERKLSQGHKQLLPRKIPKEGKDAEVRRQVIELLRNGKKLSQIEVRKTFSHYLGCVLNRITGSPLQDDNLEIVFKFLQKASNYLRSPHPIKIPTEMLESKDRAALVARLLHDFLCLYNRETEIYVEKGEGNSDLPQKLFHDFLEHARECDLEEVLILQTSTPINQGRSGGLKGVINCISKSARSSSYKEVMKSKPSVKITSLS